MPDCCLGRPQTCLLSCPVQVIGLCERKRDPQPKHIIADTPGQIEIFTWSASGAIITEVPGSAVKAIDACHAHLGSCHKMWYVLIDLCNFSKSCHAVMGFPQAFASTFPTMVAYVIDTPRCTQPQVFMSNMLQVRPQNTYTCCTLLLSRWQLCFARLQSSTNGF